MKILVVGATGFIGHAIYKALNHEYQVIAGIRDTRYFSEACISIDFTTIHEDKALVERLEGIDVLINAVGIIAAQKNQTFEQMHAVAAKVLIDASVKAKVKRLIHISALGSQTGTTSYHTSKDKADIYLRNSGLDYAILHPSIVYGDDGKSTALFQALSALPWIPIIGEGTQKLQPITVDDLVETVKRVLVSEEKQIELNLVGETEISYKELLQGFRKWLGLRETSTISVPTFGTNILGKILGEPTVNQDNIIMLNEGNVADVKPLEDFLGYTPIGIQKKLFSSSAFHSQKLYASLYLIRPLLRMIIGLVWIWSGLVSAFFYPQPLALGLLHDIGIPVGIDLPLLYVASFLDVLLGILTLIGYRLQLLLLFQITVIVVYTLLLSFLAPHHWLHPFGPVLKNIPLVVTIYILSRLEKYR